MQILAQVDLRELVGDLLPFLIVVLLGVLGFARKIFETYMDKERRRAKNEGRSARSPFSSLKDFIEGLQEQQSPGRKPGSPKTSSPVRPSVLVGGRDDVSSPSPPEPIMEPIVRALDKAQAAFERGSRSGGRSRRRPRPSPVSAIPPPRRLGTRGIPLDGRRVTLGEAVRLSEILGRPMALRTLGELPPGLDDPR